MVRRIRALGSGFIASLALLLATSVASQECKHPDPQLCAVENAFGGSLVVPQVTEYFDVRLALLVLERSPPAD